MFLHFNWFIEKNLYFVRKYFWENLVYIVTFVLQFFLRVRLCSNETPIPKQICTDLVGATLRAKILGNRLVLSTQILIAMDYFLLFLLFQRSVFYLEKIKAFFKEHFLAHPIQVTESTYCRIVFQTMYIPKICTYP